MVYSLASKWKADLLYARPVIDLEAALGSNKRAVAKCRSGKENLWFTGHSESQHQ